MIPLANRLASPSRQWTERMSTLSNELRVSMPGIVQSFDATKQTVTVQLAITEMMLVTDSTGVDVPTPTPLLLLADVPIVLPTAGGFTLTLPIKAGDECDVIFGDNDFGAWWQSGGVQNQIMNRRHDLTDAKAHFGLRNQTRVLENYSTTNAQLRSDDGTVMVDLAPSALTLKAPTVNVETNQLNAQVQGAASVNSQSLTAQVSGSASLQAEQITINGGGQTSIDGVNFLEHIHAGVQGGPGTSGPVVP